MTDKEPTNTILAVSPSDIKMWESVQKVREQLGKDCATTRLACQRAGISHNLYYTALQNGYVQAQLAAELGARKQVLHQVLEKAWAPMLINMANVAASGDSKESVQAARLLVELEKGLQEDSKLLEGPGNKRHPARALLESAKKATIRRTTVVEEVEITPDDAISDGNPVIDAEP
jgi:hypothetical protein